MEKKNAEEEDSIYIIKKSNNRIHRNILYLYMEIVNEIENTHSSTKIVK